MNIKMIAAVSSNGVIGIENKLPFDYSADMKHFRTKTLNNVIIMGRKTFESIGKALPKRENIVISRNVIDVSGIKTFPSIKSFFDNERIIIRDHIPEYWFVGGAMIYEEGMNWAQEIHLTVTPDIINHEQSTRFPWINPLKWEVKSVQNLVPDDEELQYVIYNKK